MFECKELFGYFPYSDIPFYDKYKIFYSILRKCAVNYSPTAGNGFMKLVA